MWVSDLPTVEFTIAQRIMAFNDFQQSLAEKLAASA
jgi:hypothetical protein